MYTQAEAPIHPGLTERGLTKREYFAAMALQGMLASWPKDARLNPDTTAERATLFADALIAALKKEPQS